MKRKRIATAILALMAVALPMSSVAGGVLSISNKTMMSAYAIETSDEGYLKDGDIVHVKKTDFGALKSYTPVLMGTLAVDDEFLIGTLRRNATDWKYTEIDVIERVNFKEEDKQEFDIVYDSKAPIVICHTREDWQVDDVSTKSHVEQWYRLKPNGEWIPISHSTTPVAPNGLLEVTAQFSRESLGEYYDWLEGAKITIYDTDGNAVATTDRDGTFKHTESNYTSKYNWVADMDCTLTVGLMHHGMKGKINGSFVGDLPYITTRDYTEQFEYDNPDDGDISSTSYYETDSNGGIITDSNGKPALTNINKVSHGDVEVIKNTEVIQTYSKEDFKQGVFVIKDYDKTATYFLKVATDDTNSNYIYYKYDQKVGAWEFRVNTEETPLYKVKINFATFPHEYAEGVLYKKRANGYSGDKLDSWTKQVYAGGSKTVDIYTNKSGYTYTAFFDYKTSGGIYYQYVGIDPVPVNAYGKRAEGALIPTVDIPTNAGVGDKIAIDGIGNDGNKIHYDTAQKYPDGFITVPADGNFTVTDENSGLKNNVTDGDFEYKDSKSDDVMNLTEPVTMGICTVQNPSGSISKTGTIKGDASAVGNLISDTSIPKSDVDKLKGEAYYKFEITSGVVNSTDPSDITKDNGYFIFDKSYGATDGDITRIYVTGVKGDVNQDKKFNIADLVLEQKYLLTALGEERFEIENFIASDVITDGSSDVFDMVCLRQMLAEQLKK